MQTFQTTTAETETMLKENNKKRTRKDVTAAELYDGIKDSLRM